MKSIRLERFGLPAEVLRVQELPAPAPASGQARVRMTMAPINPSDLMVVRGQYGRLPQLPATPGFEGVGVVEAVGGGFLAKLRGIRPGRRVAVLHGHGGTWQEHVALTVRQLVPLPDDLPDEQAAGFFVNPATALVMIQHVLEVPAGAWLLQTAAASALGKMIIKLGKHMGFRTINVVRRPDHAEELRKLGGDAVICTQAEDIEKRVQEITGGKGVPFALDAVGGGMGLGAVKALGHGGRMLVYGTLSGDPIPLDPRLIMVGQKTIEGFWLSEWVKRQGVFKMLKLFRQITRLMQADILTTPVQATFELDQVKDAVTLAETPGRHGKVLLRMA